MSLNHRVRFPPRSLGLMAVTGGAFALLSWPTFVSGQPLPYVGNATLIGKVRSCGGPAPGHCFAQRNAKVRATLLTGKYVGAEASGATDVGGRFEFHLRPGHWRVVVRPCCGIGAKEKMQVVLKAHTTVHVRFTFHIH